ncbi:MAG TPA: GNAT family N-acetyltransferase, partial [Microlunatus sp.]|nr:GNAT family N-acetyltransferase [Microlunatus sp.]
VGPGLSVAADYPGGFGHGSLLATGGLRRSDVATVVADLRGRGLSTRIGGGHHTADQWSAGVLPGVVEVPRRVDVIELPSDPELYLAGPVRRDVRQNVAKAARRGVEVERDTTGRLVPVFYDLYRSWLERWIPRSGLPPALARYSALKQEPYAKFETVAALMGDHCRTFVAWHQGRAVASCLTFVYGEHAIGWRSYSIKELSGPVGANTAVQVAGIQDAIASGCRYFDLGQSGDVSQLQSYKSSLGASPRRVVDLRIEPPALTRARTLADRGKQGAIGLLNRLTHRQD